MATRASSSTTHPTRVLATTDSAHVFGAWAAERLSALLTRLASGASIHLIAVPAAKQAVHAGNTSVETSVTYYPDQTRHAGRKSLAQVSFDKAFAGQHDRGMGLLGAAGFFRAGNPVERSAITWCSATGGPHRCTESHDRQPGSCHSRRVRLTEDLALSDIFGYGYDMLPCPTRHDSLPCDLHTL